MHIGIFGGTFDPIHLGHLRAAEEVAEKCRLDKVLFMPSGRPPHRRAPQTAPEHRLAMTRLAVRKNPNFNISTLEIEKPGKAYTIETVRALKKSYPQTRFDLILGADQCMLFQQWHEAGELLRLCRVVAMSRPGLALEDVQRVLAPLVNHDLDHHVKMVNVSKLDISSTAIRHRLQQGRSIRYLVTPEVESYIKTHHLYSFSSNLNRVGAKNISPLQQP